MSSPGFEDLWQMHWSYNALLEQNSPALYIANIEDAPTIAAVLTAPPRGGGPGRGRGRAPPGRAEAAPVVARAAHSLAHPRRQPIRRPQQRPRRVDKRPWPHLPPDEA